MLLARLLVFSALTLAFAGFAGSSIRHLDIGPTLPPPCCDIGADFAAAVL